MQRILWTLDERSLVDLEHDRVGDRVIMEVGAGMPAMRQCPKR
jgi:hypothetical protein